ncbi:MAG: hypothetical protein AAFX93_12885 [Verrucomicrobiota bacterium]
MNKILKRLFVSALICGAAFFAFFAFTFFIYPGTTKSWTINDANRAFTAFILDPKPVSVQIHDVKGMTSMTGDWMEITFSASEEDSALIQSQLKDRYTSESSEEATIEKKGNLFYFSYWSP